jgi:F0F1-type ATP synthase membrane subunit c/vacuolar-type H+-ATPase subunit K
MCDIGKIELFFCGIVIFLLGLAAGFMTGFAMGSGLEAKEQVKEQKKLLFEQNKLLKLKVVEK